MNSFSLWVGLGATLGLWRVASSAPQRQATAWVNSGLIVLTGALIGARAFYVGINWGYFSTHFLETFMVWLGGLSWPGAVAGTMLALICISGLYRPPRMPGQRVTRTPLGLLGDRLYPLLPPLVVTTWLGAWLSGVAYGAALPDGAWWGISNLAECCETTLHFPLQPLATLAMLIFFWLLENRIKSPRPSGMLSSLAFAGLMLHLLIVSLLRADPSPTWNGVRVDVWMSIFYLGLFTTFLLVNRLVVRIARKQSYSSL